MHLESGHVLLSLLIWPWSNSSSLWPWEFSITKLCSAAFASFQAILNAAASMVFLKHESEHFIPIFKNPQFFPSSSELLTIKGLCELSSLPCAPLPSTPPSVLLDPRCQSHWPLCCSFNTTSMLQSQELCSYCFHYLQFLFLSDIHVLLLYRMHISAQILHHQWIYLWLSSIKQPWPSAP